MINPQPPKSHHIGGDWADDPAGDALVCVYPATGETIATLTTATPALVDAALPAAANAHPAWAAMPGVLRARFLRRAATIIRDRNHDLSVLETKDTGKPLQETLIADAASGADALEHFAALAEDLRGDHIPLGEDWAYTVRAPLGVCVGIGAWNYPMQIACWKAAPALATGNTMVFKPSEDPPLSALQLAALLPEAGLPPGVFIVVQGRGEGGSALVTDPRVAKVSLTGSVPTGRKVYSAAAERMKAVTMELGGKSPLVVFADADLDAAVSGAINGNFYSSGQVCSNGTRVFVERSIREPFLARLTERLGGVTMGDPLDEAVNFGPLVSEMQLQKVLGYVDRAVADGARLVAGGQRADRPGWFVEPTVFAEVTDTMELAQEEVFGPVMAVLDFDTEDEVLTRANATPFGLAAGVFTRDLARAHRVAQAFEAGTVWINSYNLTPAGMPFGGAKASGIGRENAAAALEHYTQLKTIYVGMGAVDAAY